MSHVSQTSHGSHGSHENRNTNGNGNNHEQHDENVSHHNQSTNSFVYNVQDSKQGQNEQQHQQQHSNPHQKEQQHNQSQQQAPFMTQHQQHQQQHHQQHQQQRHNHNQMFPQNRGNGSMSHNNNNMMQHHHQMNPMRGMNINNGNNMNHMNMNPMNFLNRMHHPMHQMNPMAGFHGMHVNGMNNMNNIHGMNMANMNFRAINGHTDVPIFGYCHPKYITILNYNVQNPNSNLIQRMIFNDSKHHFKPIISVHGFDNGVHRWDVRLTGTDPSSYCKLKQPILQIGVVSLDLDKFFAKEQKQQQQQQQPQQTLTGQPTTPSAGIDKSNPNCNENNNRGNTPVLSRCDEEVNFYSENGVNLGFSESVYYTCNLRKRTAHFGQVQWNSNLNVYCRLEQTKDNLWHFGDIISLELDCNRKELRFYKNYRILIGSRTWRREFLNGVAHLGKNKLYYPALCCLGCDCGGKGKGFVLDLLKTKPLMI